MAALASYLGIALGGPLLGTAVQAQDGRPRVDTPSCTLQDQAIPGAAVFRGVPYAAPPELGRQVVRDLVFTAFSRRITVLQAKQAPTFRYYFDHVPQAVRASSVGVAHGGEVPWVFGTADLCGCLGAELDDVDRRAGAALLERWATCARKGRPDLPAGPAWPADTLLRPVVMNFGAQSVERGFMAQRLNTLIGGLRFVGRGGG